MKKLFLLRHFESYTEARKWLLANFQVANDRGLTEVLFRLVVQEKPTLSLTVDLVNGSVSATVRERGYRR